jgi:hypothetical protein
MMQRYGKEDKKPNKSANILHFTRLFVCLHTEATISLLTEFHKKWNIKHEISFMKLTPATIA